MKAENWRHIAWGDPPKKIGRIPLGILIALQEEAESIVFGTGASRKVFKFGNSAKFDLELAEAEYSHEFLRVHFGELKNFDVFCQRLPEFCQNLDSIEVSERVMKRITLDLGSMNTMEEIANAGDIFLNQDIDRIILVSSSSHAPRCLRDAATVFHNESRFERFMGNIFVVPSVTTYEGTNASDVVVIEPPHRPDRHVVPTHRRMQRMLTLQNLPYVELVNLIEEFDDLLQRYEDKYFKLGSKR